MQKATLLFITSILLWNITAYGQEKLEVEGAIIIGNSEDLTPATGTIQWNGTDFVGWNGQRWVSLTGYATVGTVTDIDGNTYETTRIGNQEWMIENLRVRQFNDGRGIPEVISDVGWVATTFSARSRYDNSNANLDTYGYLYNWFAVDDGKLCPTDWHVPSDAEWTTLTDFLGGLTVAGGKMKEEGTAHWNSPNTGASNESGFTGLPGGDRSTIGPFFNIGSNGFWWSSTESSGSNAWYRGLFNDNVYVDLFNLDKRFGISVRCVRD